ncbi:GNAT family N-acetyltransferase [Sulfitobacter albidus]|uniref:GNAT family N-acetyltransferase n=1 Tax=Sulfitobacter albidus TaxID=2829501 RepID=A0A975PL05_9RHOB|nr:GNAT family N-acetyltransferase [Sulfitobacter albidus]QUJ75169.1 GNAT family N-acetyltransferase [Sulfitobacter albidus]
MSLWLDPLSTDDFARVAHITVAPAQIKFSGTVAEAFETAEPGVDFHAIVEGDTPVGFFKIDRDYAQRYPFAAPDGLGLRAFLIDHAQQGRGLATRAVRALPAYLARHYIASTLYLTVNLVNAPAIRCYLAGGFTDTGDIWPHGDAGPQHIMRMDLRTAR